jgi:hypothetical protein
LNLFALEAPAADADGIAAEAIDEERMPVGSRPSIMKNPTASVKVPGRE